MSTFADFLNIELKTAVLFVTWNFKTASQTVQKIWQKLRFSDDNLKTIQIS